MGCHVAYILGAILFAVFAGGRCQSPQETRDFSRWHPPPVCGTRVSGGQAAKRSIGRRNGMARPRNYKGVHLIDVSPLQDLAVICWGLEHPLNVVGGHECREKHAQGSPIGIHTHFATYHQSGVIIRLVFLECVQFRWLTLCQPMARLDTGL